MTSGRCLCLLLLSASICGSSRPAPARPASRGGPRGEGILAAGLGVASNAKPVVQQAADTTVNVPFLDAIIYLLGISREEVEAADAEAGIITPSPPI